VEKTNKILNDLWRLSPARMAEHFDGGDFKRYHHIDYLDRILAPAIARGNARLIISMPPRSGKSLLTSFYTPAWFLSLYPKRNVILASYEANFAASWGRRVRNFIEENSDQLGIRLASDSTASDRFHLLEGGSMVTAGAGGSITGRGASLAIIDDPIKNAEEANSQTQRDKMQEWFSSVMLTRLEPGASMIVMMTRWHQDDLIGRLLREQTGWTEVRLAALAEENDPLGRPVGAALCPERYDELTLADTRIRVGSRIWDSLYQQRPTSDEGNIIKRDWFKFYQFLPAKFDQVIMSADLTFKDTKNSDYVVIQIWGKLGANKYLIDQVRARMDFPTTIAAIEALTRKYPKANAKLIEDKANGPAVISALKAKISGLIAVEPQGSKEARACAVSPEIEAGNVWLPDPLLASWVKDFIEEVVSFPLGRHDDMVDAMAQALNRLRGGHQRMFAPISGHYGLMNFR